MARTTDLVAVLLSDWCSVYIRFDGPDRRTFEPIIYRLRLLVDSLVPRLECLLCYRFRCGTVCDHMCLGCPKHRNLEPLTFEVAHSLADATGLKPLFSGKRSSKFNRCQCQEHRPLRLSIYFGCMVPSPKLYVSHHTPETYSF